MASALATPDAQSVYGELFAQLESDIRRMVWTQLGSVGGRREDVEDGVSYIFQQLWKNQVMDQFDPQHISKFTHRPVTPKAFIMAKVALYCRGLREQLARHVNRELLWLDGGDDGESASTLLDELAGASDDYPSLEGMGLDALREALAARENTPGRAPVLPLFDALAARCADGRRVSLTAMSQQFKLDKEGIGLWFEELKAALSDVVTHKPVQAADPAPVVPETVEVSGSWFAELRSAASGVPVFELGGMTLTAGEVRAAADALREVRGNRVMPAFVSSGHRLAGAGKTWYLDFAEQVMQAYPALRTPVKRHEEGHFGRVKNALIFGLDRLTDSLPVDLPVGEAVALPVVPDDPDDAAARWAEFEAALRRLPGLDGEAGEAAYEAVRMLAEVT